MRSLLFAVWTAMLLGTAPAQTAPPGQVNINGGDDLDPRDHGRPVILIAAALKVPADVFRETFTHVKPAGPGQEPEPDQVRKNKQALMAGLGPYGVTDDRLNAVSNYYRYNRSRGETWKRTPATAVATIENGVVTKITMTDPGSGYTSPPSISVPGSTHQIFTAKLLFGTDFKTNGSIQEITISNAP